MVTVTIDSLLREYRARPVARFFVWVILLGLALGLTSWLSGGVPVFLRILLGAGLTLVGTYYIIRLIRAFKHHLLWHLRRRLMVTYVFIAVVPIILILVLVVIATVMLNGQFAAFLVTLKVNDQVEELKQVNRVVAHEAHLSTARTPKELLDQLHRFYVEELSAHSASYPRLEIGFRLGPEERAFYLNGQPLVAPPTVPQWLRREEFAGIVSDDGKVYLRAVYGGESPVGAITMILSEPFSPALLDIVGAGIGPVGVFISNRNGQAPVPRGATNLRVTARSPLPRGGNTIQSQSVAMPQPSNFLDAGVVGGSTLSPIFWGGTNEKHVSPPVFVYVRSRLFMLTHQLLATLGRYLRLYVTLFLVVAAIFLVIELLSLVTGIQLTRTMTGTVDKLYVATQRVKAGDLTHRINMRAQDQLSSLGEAFDNMTTSLQRLLSESQEKARLEHDLQIAREVQEYLFPRSIPQVAGLQLYGACRPARLVSGDYYDFLPMGEDRVGIVLGDVSGKGVPAALVMAAVQSVIRAQLHLGPSSRLSTADFFRQLSQQMFENTSHEHYATCFYGLYDAKSRWLVYTNAGHPAPLLFRNGKIDRLDVGGVPLGLISPMTYKEAEVALEPGDVLVAFSDGLTESENILEEQFGEERLIEAVRRARAKSLEAMVEEVYRSVEDWHGGKKSQDDMTLIVVRVSA